MKYLNLGCGVHYSTDKIWTNLDFISNDDNVIAHNLLKGIPFNDGTYDLVYHSHVLEHFSKQEGEEFISECFRVLKPGGILRVAVPDLEMIARNYLECLNAGLANLTNEKIRSHYEWMLIEMYDQTVRNQSGGNMIKYLLQEELEDEEFVLKRIGIEGFDIRKSYFENRNNSIVKPRFISGVKSRIKNAVSRLIDPYYKFYKLGSFRKGGEIHQWMYDRYSLGNLLTKSGGKTIEIRDAFSSYVPDWASFGIDGKDGLTRKPDSLFIEAVK